MLVTLVMLATCFGLLCGIGILFGIVGLLLKFGGKENLLSVINTEAGF